MQSVLHLRFPGTESTRAAARRLAEVLDARGAVLALRGPLGAGKTLFVKGLAEGLGIDPACVASPTFVIASEYRTPDGRRLAHVDLYRIESEAELEAAGFLDLLAPGTILAVEWADRLPDALPADRLEIALERGSDPDVRDLTATAHGPHAARLLGRWRELLPYISS